MGRTAPLNSKLCNLCIYSTNIGNEYFKRDIHSPFFKCSLLHNSNVFSSCIIRILYTGCAKIKKNNSGVKRLKTDSRTAIGLGIFVQDPLCSEQLGHHS